MFGFFKERNPEPQNVDLAAVDSREKAQALLRTGALEKLLLMPREFGGSDHPMNTIFVPPEIVKQKAKIDREVIAPLIEAGKVTKYSVKPEYEGTSMVPTRLTIKVSDPEAYQFPISIWGSAIDGESKLWDQVYVAREAIYAEHFGAIDGDVQKLMNLTGVWPGGCLVQIHAARHQLWVSSSFGLTNPDMPARIRPEQFTVEQDAQGQATQYSTRLVARPPRAVPAGWAGYGYEILLLTRQKDCWPLGFLNWAVQAEILNDMDLLGRIRKYGAMTVEDVSIGEGKSADFLIAPLQKFAPPSIALPNGAMELLVATLITRSQMQYGIEKGGPALLAELNQTGSGQISHALE
ncbi:MAG TPA: hypothetical protein VN737_17910 [Bryobacteraceae bacterium]|nr:hypothetical protein [Bryobacteraceae bacterium]